MQSLKIYQSLWAMQLRGPDGYEHGDEKSFQMIADAGYDGVCVDPTAQEIDENLALKPYFEQHGLEVMVNAFPKSDDDLRRLLEFAQEMNATQFSIIGVTYPLTISGAIPIIRKWIEISEQIGMPIMFETHRDCITNDMFFTLQLLDEIPEMRLCADLSHYVLNRELSTPLTREWAALFDRLLARSDSFQGRIANREQIQVPIEFEQHQEWVSLFKHFWSRGFNDWRSRASEDQDLIFLCELGPPPYAITDKNRAELSDRWQEALIIKKWAEEIWANSSAQSIY
jgi:hypothetical protein